MKIFKNIITGFLISFVGALPLGYLNLFGLHIYSNDGLSSLIYFLTGIITVEVIIVAVTLKGVLWLTSQKKLVITLKIFSIAILLFFAAYFFFYNHTTTPLQIKSVSFHPYLLGLVLSAFNFFQIPFWTGWNLVVINTKRIHTEKMLPYLYVAGTAMGTLAGMGVFVFGFDFLLTKTSVEDQWINVLLPIMFLLIACIQIYKLLLPNNSSKNLQIQTSS